MRNKAVVNVTKTAEQENGYQTNDVLMGQNIVDAQANADRCKVLEESETYLNDKLAEMKRILADQKKDKVRGR